MDAQRLLPGALVHSLVYTAVNHSMLLIQISNL